MDYTQSTLAIGCPLASNTSHWVVMCRNISLIPFTRDEAYELKLMVDGR
jgi:hypothetical protein